MNVIDKMKRRWQLQLKAINLCWRKTVNYMNTVLCEKKNHHVRLPFAITPLICLWPLTITTTTTKKNLFEYSNSVYYKSNHKSININNVVQTKRIFSVANVRKCCLTWRICSSSFGPFKNLAREKKGNLTGQTIVSLFRCVKVQRLRNLNR